MNVIDRRASVRRDKGDMLSPTSWIHLLWRSPLVTLLPSHAKFFWLGGCDCRGHRLPQVVYVSLSYCGFAGYVPRAVLSTISSGVLPSRP